MENLHESMLSEILYRIPLEFVVSCKLVSKRWNDILSQKKVAGVIFLVGSYWERNLQLYYGNIGGILKTSNLEKFSYKELIKMNHPLVNRRKSWHPGNFMVGSCNGLVCFSVPHHCISDPVYVTNPISGEYVNLPRLHAKRGRVVGGFGYLCSSNEYKVVRIFYPDQEENSHFYDGGVGWVQVYTLGGDDSGWRNIGDITYSLLNEGVLLDGSLYWMASSEGKILAFDLADEEFRVVSSLPCDFGSFSFLNSLKILGGHLCVVHQRRGHHVDIWSFKTNQQSKYGCQMKKGYLNWSWSLEFNIPCSLTRNSISTYDPFSLTENNEVLLWLDQTILCRYDPKTKTLNKILNLDLNDSVRICQPVPYLNCLVSLRSLGVNSKRRVKSYGNQVSSNLVLRGEG